MCGARVSAARVARVKEAATEAQADIRAYRRERELEFESRTAQATAAGQQRMSKQALRTHAELQQILDRGVRYLGSSKRPFYGSCPFS